MSTFYKGAGYFSLNDSDNNVGSFFSINDLFVILQIKEENKSDLVQDFEDLKILHEGYIDEKDIYTNWKYLRLKHFYNKSLSRASFDEYVLRAIFEKTFNGAIIEQQVKFGRRIIDFKITYHNITKYIEFDGPSHFISSNGKKLEDPFIHAENVEKETGCELVRWPYWIQRCTSNALRIFDKSVAGKGALWSTKKYFGDFAIPNACSNIIKLTQRFSAEDENGIGYFYEKNTSGARKPTHPLIAKIIKDHSKIRLLIPPGARENEVHYWLPKTLWYIIDNEVDRIGPF